MGRVGVGSDANPLGYLLTAAKVDAPSTEEVRERLHTLRQGCVLGDPQDAHEDIRMLYSGRVLGQLLWLRRTLRLERRDDRFLMALVLGLMHANYKPGRPIRGLSISMPNTFSMSAGYVRRYIDLHGLTPPDVDVFDLLDKKIDRLELPAASAVRGSAWQQDAREPLSGGIIGTPAKLVFTSPPYLGVIRYGKYNWIRLWMLQEDPRKVDRALVATGSLSRYVEFMKLVMEQLRAGVRQDGYLCLMVGDVYNRASDSTTNLATSVWERVAQPLGWHLHGVVTDRLPTQHKVSRIWNKGRGRATKTDRVLILSPPGKSVQPLPGLGRIRWQPKPKWTLQGVH